MYSIYSKNTMICSSNHTTRQLDQLTRAGFSLHIPRRSDLRTLLLYSGWLLSSATPIVLTSKSSSLDVTSSLLDQSDRELAWAKCRVSKERSKLQKSSLGWLKKNPRLTQIRLDCHSVLREGWNSKMSCSDTPVVRSSFWEASTSRLSQTKASPLLGTAVQANQLLQTFYSDCMTSNTAKFCSTTKT